MAVARQIVGPQEQFERTGAQSLRDIRPVHHAAVRRSCAAPRPGIVLAICAGATFFEPAFVDVTVPLSALYALWVLTRRRGCRCACPASAACPDPSNPTPGSRKPKPANGTFFIGWSIYGPRTLANRRGRPAAHRPFPAPRVPARRRLF